ncbi:winged helix-turn-helix domain-containing protein [Enterobacter sp. R1(2018)]|uniref:winged helix-turn-helix domain-containing protein n=1 Tax=Enterobacter sp. R1(2018) TaxID=2447891 RepID=UPI000EADC63A|nr:winged helix-turn-helix domain-containing protein [Enterobacter sp. R1(2018)]RKQ41271.1 hypothetical protein D8M09_02750 [Enterobacter sp. R1(2018)]
MQINNGIIVINHTVYFSPRMNMLYPAGDEEAAISLNTPVSRCLALLLEQAGEVVPRKTFYTEVWEKQGLYVTDNTFYQNISILRRALKTAGVRDDVIQTVPRQGIRFTGTALPLSTTLPQTQNATYQTNENRSVDERQPFFQPELKNSQRSRLKILTSAVSIIFIIAAMYLIAPLISEQQHDVFNSFHTISLESCTVHYYGAVKENEVSHILNARGIKCQNNHEIFLTVSDKSARTSIILCEKYSKTSQECQSWLFVGGNRE